ncbi:MAG: lipopolysaccharide transport periplasmic protein LptA [Xanthomonadales bacterium]|nr:lipopolysaccharide transport periplasmic protein LptA [Xanthomonadales bacterium]
MSYRTDSRPTRPAVLLAVSLAVSLAALLAQPVLALETDRQQPLEVYADGTDGSLGDGVTVLSGRVEIRQGTLHVQAEEARVEKFEGKVSTIILIGQPARLEQEIEEQGLVQAEANTITYRVSAGKVELAGAADVTHPQYQISGEQLTYDLDKQHFEGSGGVSAEGDGRIRIQLEPEVAGQLQDQPADGGAAGEAGEQTPETDPPDAEDPDSGAG